MGDLDIESKPIEEEQGTNGLTNGISNGTPDHKEHKHSSKDKDRDRNKDKDRHRDKDRHKSSHRDKDRDKDKERSKDKDRHSSSHKSSHKDKDRDKSRDKDRERHRDKDKERSDRDKDRHKDRSDRDKNKDKERSDKDKDKTRDKEDTHKDRERSDKDKERSDKDKERRDKDKERSEKHRDRDKEKDRHRDDKDKKSSSSSRKDKHHSSSHKSSHKDKHRDRDRDKEREKVVVKEEIKEEPLEADSQEESLNNSMEDFKPSYTAIKEEESEDDNLVIKEENVEDEEEQQQEEEEEEEQQQEEEEVDDDEDDVPLVARKRPKREYVEEEDEDDDIPLIARKKKSEKRRKKTEEEEDEDFKPVKSEKKKKRKKVEDDDEDDFKPAKKKVKKEKGKANKSTESATASPKKGKKKTEEEQHVWKWWEEEKRDDGRKWTFLEHRGPVFADPYVRLPSNIKFYYDGEHVVLSESAEEVATFYAKMLDHDYTTKEMFNKNFFKDWKKTMTSKERELIKELSKCNFKKMHAYFVQQNEDRKNRSKEEKKELKAKNEEVIKEYGWCTIDGHKQRIGNFKIEPPGLFRGRGEHPKQGMVKRRTMPEDVRINCSKDSNIPKAPAGHKWKEVRHDPTVTWLACWNENIQGSTKYVMLNAASKLKGEKDWQKYETARKLHKHVDRIRESYKTDWKSKEMRVRQRGVALYFIDKLALRAGNEKDEDQADTVGCCSIRVEHLALHEKKDGKEFVVVFDFPGKDSIRYYNEVPVEKRVFKNLQLFVENKQDGDDVFDRLNTQILNKYLNELLDGLTAKVFRTYNASRTLQEQLEKMTDPEDPIPAQILAYNRANREVAILCNHQRAVPKTFDKSMANLQKKIDDKKEQIHDAEKECKDLKRAAKHGGTVKEKVTYEKKKKAVERLKEQLEKLEISATDKEENKQIALGTSKLNYLDPRITVAWCRKNNIPVDKVYNKTQRLKFQWAIDMATADFNFMNYDSTQQFKREDDDEEEEEEEEE